jgi:Leucine-rich repeat (LRR) protein
VAPTCTQLTSINISRNQLVSLPEPLTGLRALQKLNVSHNKLTQLPAGILTAPELQILQASNNHLRSLPGAVAEGCGLQVIDLHGNQLTSLPQQLIIRAPHLHTLNVSSNQLSVLPLVSPQGPGPSLSTLLAADNRLGDGVLPSISCCKNLKVLHLAYNNFESILPSTFTQMKQLEYLNLSGNALSSFPSLPYCFHLHTLSLHSSLLTTLPEDTPPMRKLMNLDLAANKLTQVSKLNQLKYVDLSDNSNLKIKESDVDKLR